MFISDEESKAVQEVAKTSSRGLDVIEGFGRFIAHIVGHPTEQAVGLLTDKLRYMRVEQATSLKLRLEESLNSTEVDKLTNRIPLNILCPLLEAVTLEEEPDAQQLWANLLVNGIDASSEVEVTKSLVSVLRELGSIEARCLSTIAVAWEGDMWAGTPFGKVPIYGLPYEVKDRGPDEVPKVDENVHIALLNLKRLGCIDVASDMDGVVHDVFAGVKPSVLGLALIRACTRKG